MVNAVGLIRNMNRVPEVFVATRRTPAYYSCAGATCFQSDAQRFSTGDMLMRTAGESPKRKIVLDEDNEACEETVSVPCIGLAECLTRFDISMLDMLKMDIEGSEWAVLLSSSRDVLQRIRHIQLEYHEVDARFGYQPEQLFSHLAAAGHRLTFRTSDKRLLSVCAE